MANGWTQWSRAEARAVLEEFQASGLSMAEFGRRRGIQASRLRRWRLRLGEEGTAPGAAPETGLRLVELVAGRGIQGGIFLHCPSGHTVELPHVDLVVGLRAVLRAVAEASSEC